MDSTAENFTRRMVLLLLLGSLALETMICFSEGISGNDYWWHVKAGEWMTTNRQILKTDVFSWTVPGHAWVSHEWFSEIIFYYLWLLGGDLGIFFFSLTGSMLLLILCIAVNKDRLFDNVIFTCVFFPLFAINNSLFFYGRPQVFSYFLLFGELYCIDIFLKKPDSRWIFGVPFLGLLWANFHGGSSNLPYLLLFFVLIASLPIRKGIGRVEFILLNRRQKRHLICVLGMTVIAICINPYGYKMLLYPYEQMADNFMTSIIAEWAAPNAKNLLELFLFFMPVVLSISGFFVGDKKIRCYDLLLMCFFLFLFLRSIRFIPLFYIAAVFWAFDYVLPCKIKPVREKSERRLVILCIAIFMTLGLVYGGKKLADLILSGEVLQKEVSEEMLTFVKEQRPQALFNDYGLGGILIYHDIKVFFDGRADLYEECGILKEGYSLTHLKPTESGDGSTHFDVRQIMEKYGFDAFLIQDIDPLFQYLRSHEETYEMLKYDGNGNVYFKVR